MERALRDFCEGFRDITGRGGGGGINRTSDVPGSGESFSVKTSQSSGSRMKLHFMGESVGERGDGGVQDVGSPGEGDFGITVVIDEGCGDWVGEVDAGGGGVGRGTGGNIHH